MVSKEQIIKFVDTVAPLAVQVCEERGYGNAQAWTCVCQAAQETGWGVGSNIMMTCNAILGIKATENWIKEAKYGGRVYSAKTQEYYDGKTATSIKGTFRAYGSLLDSVRDYFDLMEINLYRDSLTKNTVPECMAVIGKHYATGPNYAQHVVNCYNMDIVKSQLNKYTVGTQAKSEPRSVFEFHNPIQNNIQFAETAIQIANNYKTFYVNGAWGWVMNSVMKERAIREHGYNANNAAQIRALPSNTFGFDCICLLKGILWGWCGNYNQQYGGAGYACNGVPDITETAMIQRCNAQSTDFSNVQIGEMLYYNVNGNTHAGIYVGDGLAVECTDQWKNGVQITAVLNIGAKQGYNGRKWTKHGMLPYFSYVGGSIQKPSIDLSQYTDEQLAHMVLENKFGNNPQRQKLLGNRYRAVQDIVNRIVSGQKPNDIYYTVKPGDTLSGIASQFGTTYQKIAADNNIANPNIIFPGQKLVIRK